MGIIKDLFNRDRIALVKENQKIRRHKKSLEKDFDKYKEAKEEEISELKDKYINILEQKSEVFDKYLHYQEEAIKLANEKRELKRELAEAKEK